ncbi:protein TRACHEARY ELEMENT DIFFERENTIATION-RELATED 7A-like [Homalodisca vitripennis]|uniref:protein TRACHEARY ELEMENT DIFFERENTIATION-RELATED 7A-like n=1 Tax=Homalodisca vitripennis TaxID=197043 RepID=UPI001EEB2FE0|nr:protein TRACHEARY ELEMENT DIFFERENTIATION-RELATED 7A-like [Homalodisca vitripennis]
MHGIPPAPITNIRYPQPPHPTPSYHPRRVPCPQTLGARTIMCTPPLSYAPPPPCQSQYRSPPQSPPSPIPNTKHPPPNTTTPYKRLDLNILPRQAASPQPPDKQQRRPYTADSHDTNALTSPSSIRLRRPTPIRPPTPVPHPISPPELPMNPP